VPQHSCNDTCLFSRWYEITIFDFVHFGAANLDKVAYLLPPFHGEEALLRTVWLVAGLFTLADRLGGGAAAALRLGSAWLGAARVMPVEGSHIGPLQRNSNETDLLDCPRKNKAYFPYLF